MSFLPSFIDLNQTVLFTQPQFTPFYYFSEVFDTKNTIFVLKPLVEKRSTLTLIQKNSLLHVHQNLDIQQKKCKTPNIRGREFECLYHQTQCPSCTEPPLRTQNFQKKFVEPIHLMRAWYIILHLALKPQLIF